ncbi:MAG TPA: PrsW family glutamic-type intramembrane protease [Vicinamibacterales bacterium]|nr:PrsW family glutamic-type intramembrane protease [Vicinamibacterales bacterium]
MLNLTAGLAPVLSLLVLLMLMDSFKLVPMRFVMQALAAGAAAALAALALHLQIIDSLGVPIPVVTRFIAPVVEELFKLVFVIYAVRSRRIGFPVDAAIVGFAVGTGFALVENGYYLMALKSPGVVLWLVRGFGAAILHGALTAIAAIIAQELAARRHGQGFGIFVPGLLAAIAIHWIYNQFVFPPVVATLLLLIVLPPLLLGVFTRSERATREWMSDGLDLDVELLKLVLSEDFGQTRLGTYLTELRTRFPGPVVADMFCLMRVELELGIRAKGMLMARDAGLEVPLDDEVHAALAEVRYLEKAIGPTGMLALTPLQVSSERDTWHKFLLSEQRRSADRS